VVEAAMAKAPANRPQSAVVLGEMLRASLAHGGATARMTAPAEVAPVVAAPVFATPVVQIPPAAVVPEPEPEPAIPVPVPVPEPTPEPVPEPEPAPVPVPEPEPTPSPIPEPDPIPVPEPSPAPEPVAADALAPDATPAAAISVPAVSEPEVPLLPAVEGEAAPGTGEPKPPVELTMAAVGRAIEADPDESSRSRGRFVRFGLGAAVALVSLVVLVFVIYDSSRSKVGTPTSSRNPPATKTTTATLATPLARVPPLGLPAATQTSGLVVSRTWRLAGEDGDLFLASVDVTNPTDHPIIDNVLEVIPKALTSTITNVTFVGTQPKVVNPDPIVQFDVVLQPGKSVRFGYRVNVPAEGVTTARLTGWKRARDTEQAALDVALTAPLKGKAKPGG
jgi:outer membrane biosynthesis protein TonB